LKVRLIYLSWRKEKGARRKLVGVLKSTATNGILFKYLKEGVEDARKEGFVEYPGFPIDFDKEYHEDNLDIFSLRLIPFERADRSKYLSFWEAANISDKFSLLAYTQGFSQTDNFEFLGLFHPKVGLKFVTDLAGISHLLDEISKDSLKIGDKLSYEIEYNSLAFKSRAVKIYKGDVHLGYIKNVHNNVFIEAKSKIDLEVKSLDQNGIIKQIFVIVRCLG
jgi:hypothetical protein